MKRNGLRIPFDTRTKIKSKRGFKTENVVRIKGDQNLFEVLLHGIMSYLSRLES